MRATPAPRRTPAVPMRDKARRAQTARAQSEVLEKFREVFWAVRTHFDAVSRRLGVTGTELWALWELHQRPGQRVSDLAHCLSVRQSTVSNFIERLSAVGLVERARLDTDRRVVRLRLTAAGMRLLRAAPAPARGVLPDALARLSEQDLERLRDALAVLLAHMSGRVPGAAKTHLSTL